MYVEEACSTLRDDLILKREELKGIAISSENKQELKGSMPPCIGRMELLAWMQRADFSEHIQRFKPHGNPLNSSHFDAPNTKFAPTGYRSAPNIISQHYKQELSAKASIIPKRSTNQVSIKQLVSAINNFQNRHNCQMCAKFIITLGINTPHLRLFTSDACSLVSQL